MLVVLGFAAKALLMVGVPEMARPCGTKRLPPLNMIVALPRALVDWMRSVPEFRSAPPVLVLPETLFIWIEPVPDFTTWTFPAKTALKTPAALLLPIVRLDMPA